MTKLLYIKQLELLYLSCISTLRSANIEFSEKHEKMLHLITQHNDHLSEVDLLDTLDILHEEITKQDPYPVYEDE